MINLFRFATIRNADVTLAALRYFGRNFHRNVRVSQSVTVGPGPTWERRDSQKCTLFSLPWTINSVSQGRQPDVACSLAIRFILPAAFVLYRMLATSIACRVKLRVLRELDVRFWTGVTVAEVTETVERALVQVELAESARKEIVVPDEESSPPLL